jgi:hypothetical protein
MAKIVAGEGFSNSKEVEIEFAKHLVEDKKLVAEAGQKAPFVAVRKIKQNGTTILDAKPEHWGRSDVFEKWPGYLRGRKEGGEFLVDSSAKDPNFPENASSTFQVL